MCGKPAHLRAFERRIIRGLGGGMVKGYEDGVRAYCEDKENGIRNTR
jgi:hypothetical protein